MGAKMSGAQAVKIEQLDDAQRLWDRVKKLVEQAATNPKSQSDLMRQCHRASTDVGRLLSNGGFGALSSYALELTNVIKRPGMFQSKLGAMRDAVGKGYTGFDRSRREIMQKS